MRYLIALLCSLACASAQSLDPLLKHEDLWETPKQGFAESQKEFTFQWLSADVAQSNKGTLFSLPLVQTVVRFERDKLSQIDIQLYNRGDVGEISKEQFQELLRKAADALSAETGSQPKPLGKDPTSAVKAEMVEWRTAASIYRLEYSFTKEVKTKDIAFRAEFMRLVIAPVPKQTAFGASLQTKKFSAKDHIKSTANGDTFLDGIPMVNQGEKSYCVVATAERVMRFYGSDVDSNELAQIADTSATGGTNVDAMLGSLKKLSNRLRIRVRTLDEIDLRSIQSLIDDYNRAARHDKATPINLLGQQVIDIGALYKQMRPDLLVKVKTKGSAGTSRFMNDVQSQIRKGYPLLWSVMMGIVPEQNSQEFGGHMRLIIGYNSKTNEILFSDSWGAGHELKRHALANAWAITTGLHVIEPL